jgi:hypothetical protein
MKGIQICPNCGQPTLKVKEEAVKNQAIESKNVSSKKAKWQVCVNENCDTVYLKPETQLSKSDLKQTLFFKDKTDNAMICYCYKITKGEIRLAIENGCKSVGEVYKYLNKSKSGSCSTNNPLGKSCSGVFKYTVDQIKSSTDY